MTTLPILGPLEDWTPRRVVQVLFRIVEAWVGLAAALGAMWLGWPWWSWFVIAAFAEFAVFEFVFEPLGVSGHYWERPPRED